MMNDGAVDRTAVSIVALRNGILMTLIAKTHVHALQLLLGSSLVSLTNAFKPLVCHIQHVYMHCLRSFFLAALVCEFLKTCS